MSRSCWFSLLGLIQGSWEVQTLQEKKKKKKGPFPLSSALSVQWKHLLGTSYIAAPWYVPGLRFIERIKCNPLPEGAHRWAEQKNDNSVWRFSCAPVLCILGRSKEHLGCDSHTLTFLPWTLSFKQHMIFLAALSSPSPHWSPPECGLLSVKTGRAAFSLLSLVLILYLK